MTEPDPLETVTLLKSDFELLQAAANAAQEDFENICRLLGVPRNEQVAPRQVMHEVVFPMISSLMSTQAHVDAASKGIETAAARFGNQTIEQNGQKGLLVGKKDPKLAAALRVTAPLSRAERRRLERER